MLNQGEHAVLSRAEFHMLKRLAAESDRPEHLTPTQGELHWPPDLAGGHRRQHDMRPDRPFAAEAAPDEMGDDPDILRRNLEQVGDAFAHPEYALAGIEERQVIAFPCRDGRMRLHRVVCLDRCYVRVFCLDRSHLPAGIQVALRRVRHVLVSACGLGLVGAMHLARHGEHRG